MANTPRTKAWMFKAASRRHRAAFARISVVTVVELALPNPIAAAVGPENESMAGWLCGGTAGDPLARNGSSLVAGARQVVSARNAEENRANYKEGKQD
jgi:hypothetical protein